ncbi:hypothetical protein GBA52_010069 [Prunus armeniaca]|nr:hypothetical protein GBA52_010069 [Prunus armeniaca]
MKRKAEQELEERGNKQRMWWGDGNQWERGEMIGEGSYGSVFLAFWKKPLWELNLNDTPPAPVMAVKSAKLSDSESIQHEAGILSDFIGSPFVIQYLGEEITTIDDTGEEIFNLALEFAAGGTLDGLIQSYRGHGLPESDVRSYTRCILEGLIHIHNCDYVHCDLKPENILLVPSDTSTSGSSSFVAKIADFGLTKSTKDDMDGWRGTPRYTDPDALIDNVQKQCSDIWSLGAIVLEMLTGKPPWDVEPDSTLDDFLDMVAGEITPKIPTEISGLARDFLMKCIAVNSWERFTAQKLLLHPFVQEPQLSEPSHAKVKVLSSSLGSECGASCFKPIEDYRTNSAPVPRIQPSPGFEIPAGL